MRAPGMRSPIISPAWLSVTCEPPVMLKTERSRRTQSAARIAARATSWTCTKWKPWPPPVSMTNGSPSSAGRMMSRRISGILFPGPYTSVTRSEMMSRP